MTDKTPGRNDLCYCGSGLKYKKCHLKADQQKERDLRAWKESGRFLRRSLPQFARDDRFAEDFAIALPLFWDNLYNLDNAEEMSQDEALRFFDWFVFDYELAKGALAGQRLIQIYHAEKREDLSSFQQETLDGWLTADPFNVYTLLGYEGQTLQLADFMTGETYEVFEATGRGIVDVGEVILTRLVPVQDQLEFSTSAAYLPAAEITDLKEKLEAAKTAYLAGHPDAAHADFIRRHNTIMVHHALAEAKIQKRPQVARLDPDRDDKKTQSVVRQMRRFKK